MTIRRRLDALEGGRGEHRQPGRYKGENWRIQRDDGYAPNENCLCDRCIKYRRGEAALADIERIWGPEVRQALRAASPDEIAELEREAMKVISPEARRLLEEEYA